MTVGPCDRDSPWDRRRKSRADITAPTAKNPAPHQYLIAMIKAPNIRDGERKLKVMAGIVSMIARSPEMAAAAHAALVEPRASANRVIFQRAIDRGEISADCDVERLCMIGPAMASYRVLMLGRPVDRDFLVGNIDGIILPAAGLRTASA